VFETLSDRLTQVFSQLRGKGRLSAADIDATAREIRIALLEADVALPVVRQFIARIKERAAGAEVSQALNPAQQVIKIVHEELVGILGGEARRLRFAKNPPTVIMLAGLQGSGKTTLAGKLAHEIRTPLTIVRSSLENLEAEPVPDSARTYLERARQGSERLNAILLAMGAATRVEEAIGAAERSRLDLRHPGTSRPSRSPR